MKPFLYVLMVAFFIPVNVFSFQAPYLINVTTESERSISLTWRNNSSDYDSVYILRKSDNEAFSIAHSLNGMTADYIDSNLTPSHTYIYALIAKSADELSDTSNLDTATTLDYLCSLHVADTSIHAQMLAEWDCWNTFTQIAYTDSFCDERKMEIYCVEGNEPPRLVFQVDSTFSNSLKITIKDTPSVSSQWCFYYSMSTDSAGTSYKKSADTIFTIKASTFFKQDSFRIDTQSIISKFPIYNCGDSNTWAIKHGDSIWIKESNIADSIYSIINVKDPANPVFVGYKTYSVPYTLASTSNPYIYGNKLELGQVLYKITDNGPEIIDSSLSDFYGFINDRLLLIYTGLNTTQTSSISKDVMVASVTDDGIIDSIVVLPIGYKSYEGGAGHYNGAYVYGPYHNLLFQYSYSSALSMTDYTLTTVQYFEDSKMFYVGNGTSSSSNIYRPPKLINGYIPGDSLFIKSKFTYLDTAKKIAYLILDSSLTICNYVLAPNDNSPVRRNITNTYQKQFYNVTYCNKTITMSVPDEFIKGEAAVFDLKGRTILKTKIENSILHLNSSSLTRGIYLAGVFSQKGKQLIKTVIVR
jgi:hypothetical protein